MLAYQIFADKNSDEHSEEDAASEPEHPEGIQLLGVGPCILSRLLVSQLAAEFHGVIETRQVLVEASARGAAEVVGRRPLTSRPLPQASVVVFQRRSEGLAAVWQR